MATKKISECTALTTPADGDLLPTVDVSDTTESLDGTTKKITRANLVGTATPAEINVLAGVTAGTVTAGKAVIADASKNVNFSSGAISSVTLTTPTIASFVNATHDHSTAAGGGQTKLAYAFAASTATAQTMTATTDVKVQFGTEIYDYGSAYDHATNYRFTAAVAGKYHFDATIGIETLPDGAWVSISLWKGGALAKCGNIIYAGAASALLCPTVSADISLAVGEYIEVYVYNGDTTNRTLVANAAYNHFEGYIISS